MRERERENEKTKREKFSLLPFQFIEQYPFIFLQHPLFFTLYTSKYVSVIVLIEYRRQCLLPCMLKYRSILKLKKRRID